MSFEFDTSGHVNLGNAAFPFHNEYVEWPDLSPFVMGYVARTFPPLQPYLSDEGRVCLREVTP